MSDPEADIPSSPTENEQDNGEEAGDGDVPSKAELTSQLMKNPHVLAAIQDRLDGVIGLSSGYIESLPASVKRRIKALKKLQSEVIKIEGEFYDEVHELECKYAAKYAPHFERRREIVSGNVEPTDVDCDWPSDEEDTENDEEDDVKAKLKVENENNEKKETDTQADADVKGIPNFWLTTLKNVNILADMIKEHDEPILLALTDISIKYLQSNPIGFILEFHFSENEFFTNSVLTKKYVLRSEPDPAEPLTYEGPEIIHCEGCKIDWKANKDVTTKTIKKKQKHKGRGTTRTINKTVQVESFFNFFNPPKVPEGDAPEEEELETALAADFEIGHLLRERIIPRAVLFFTGEAIDDDDYDDENEEEELGDEDEENDPDFDPEKAKNNEQCKQQ